MDSNDPSAAAPPHHHHHQQQQQQQLLMPIQTLQQQQQQHNIPTNNSNSSYAPLPSNNNSINTNSATTNIMQNPRFPFNPMAAAAAAAPNPMDQHHVTDGAPSGFSIEPARKKRGRPRKYSPDNSIGLGLSPAPAANNHIGGGGAHVDGASGGGGTPRSSDTAAKRNRGRPPGSVKKQLDALGVPGVGFTPHVIMVEAGEDIASKIMAFSQQGPRTVCILSANGAVSNVTLRQPAMTGGTVTYEGRFEIISLSGSFLLSESNGNRSRTGGLSVSLAGSDGRVLGGGVAGILKAATSVQVVVGSFIADGKKPKYTPSTTTPPPSNMLNFGGPVTGASPPTPGGSSESAEENDDSPPNHGPGPYSNATQPIQNMQMYSTMGWPNSIKMHPS